jgi:hypothetical protein
VPGRNRRQCIELAWIPEQVDGDHCPGPGRDLALHISRIQVVSAPDQIGKDRDSLLVEDPDHRADVRDRAGDDLIARADAGCRHGDVERRGARGARLDVSQRANRAEAVD